MCSFMGPDVIRWHVSLLLLKMYGDEGKNPPLSSPTSYNNSPVRVPVDKIKALFWVKGMIDRPSPSEVHNVK